MTGRRFDAKRVSWVGELRSGGVGVGGVGVEGVGVGGVGVGGVGIGGVRVGSGGLGLGSGELGSRIVTPTPSLTPTVFQAADTYFTSHVLRQIVLASSRLRIKFVRVKSSASNCHVPLLLSLSL